MSKPPKRNETIKRDILRLLSKRDYGLTIEDVSRYIRIHRITASKYLAVLEAEKNIIVREVGKAKLHYPQRMASKLGR